MRLVTREILGSKVETKNFNRILTEFSRILNTNMILPNKQEEIIDTLVSILDELRIMEQCYIRYCNLEKETLDSIEALYKEKGIESIYDYPDPNLLLRKEFENFMIRSEIIQRYKKRLCIIFFDDKELDDGEKRRKKISDCIDNRRAYIGEQRYKIYKEMMKEDVEWLTKLTNIRGDIEHVEKNKLGLSEYGIAINNDVVTFQHQYLLKENVEVNKFMRTMFYNLYTHLEDFIAMLINLMCQYPLIVDLRIGTEKNNDSDWYSLDLGDREYIVNFVDDFREKIRQL
ncbi:MAG: hypothetical protein K0R34_1372 [Herbinix sp.]|nr:hypothetical protein [Herbinix sp.]